MRLPRRRHERSGAAAVRALLRALALPSWWLNLFRRPGPSLSQPLGLGGLYGPAPSRMSCGVASRVESSVIPAGSELSVRSGKSLAHDPARHLPRRLSSAKRGDSGFGDAERRPFLDTRRNNVTGRLGEKA